MFRPFWNRSNQPAHAANEAWLLGGLRRSSRRDLAGIGNEREMLQKFLPLSSRQHGENFRLQGQGQLPRQLVPAATGVAKLDAMGALVLLVARARDETGLLHAAEQGSHGVRIAGHQLRQLPLAQAGGITFEQCPHDGELIRCDPEMRDAPAESLVQPVPGASQERRQPAALRRINGRQGRGAGFRFGGGHA